MNIQIQRRAVPHAKTSDARAFLAKFLRDVALYSKQMVDADVLVATLELLYFNGFAFDAWCVSCGKESTFTIRSYIAASIAANPLLQAIGGPQSGPVQFEFPNLIQYLRWLNFACSRNTDHKLSFVCDLLEAKHEMRNLRTAPGSNPAQIRVVTQYALEKVGQQPAPADMALGEIAKYAKSLSKKQFGEFNRAVGLVAHDIGIGSFVYLRRILEDLIDDAASSRPHIEGFERMRMAEKIGALSEHLPPFLVENKVLYGILSKGIHELDEAECLAAFGSCKVAIELILDEHIAIKERRKKEAEASNALNKLNSQLGSREESGAN